MTKKPEHSPESESGRPETRPANEKSKPVDAAAVPNPDQPEEIGGRDGPDPTRYGDWEKNGRCIDF